MAKEVDRRRPFVRLLRLALVGLIAIPVVLYLTVNLSSLIQAERERGRLEKMATARLAERLPDLKTAQEAATRGATTPPDASWVEQICKFSTDDAGLIVSNYRESCTVVAADAWRVDDAEEARRISGRSGALTPTTGTSCVGIGAPADDSATTFIGRRSDLGRVGWCADLGFARDGHRVLEGRALTGIQDTGLLIITTTRSLMDEAIGCLHWSVLFCDNPFGDEHAFATPPTD